MLQGLSNEGVGGLVGRNLDTTWVSYERFPLLMQKKKKKKEKKTYIYTYIHFF